MFFFILPALLSVNTYLIVAAVIPAIFLMIKVYRSDKLEKESTTTLLVLAIAGVIATIIALVLEWIFGFVLDLVVPESSVLYNVILYFGIVAFAEEGAKYLLLKNRTWKSLEFNCQYDGVVYAIFVSLGFALWENIFYVLAYGFSTAIIRAVTAIPGHASFGVFMGILYGAAKKFERRGDSSMSRLFRVLSVIVPALLHGAYDYIASSDGSVWPFIIFVVILFALSYFLVDRMSKKDHYI